MLYWCTTGEDVLNTRRMKMSHSKRLRVTDIAGELLPRLSPEQVRAALRYYAEYPDEIERILAESETEASKAWLYRSLGPEAYRRLTGLSGQPRIQKAFPRWRDTLSTD